jgi:hypothetical protein
VGVEPRLGGVLNWKLGDRVSDDLLEGVVGKSLRTSKPGDGGGPPDNREGVGD